jgi:hypothetical protein
MKASAAAAFFSRPSFLGNDNVLYHSLSRPKDDRKKNADAIEFCELGDGVSAIFTKKSNTGFADLGRTQT